LYNIEETQRNRLKERDINKYKLPMKIRRKTFAPFLRVIISHKDIFE